MHLGCKADLLNFPADARTDKGGLIPPLAADIVVGRREAPNTLVAVALASRHKD